MTIEKEIKNLQICNKNLQDDLDFQKERIKKLEETLIRVQKDIKIIINDMNL